jgi:hypothetical protein
MFGVEVSYCALQMRHRTCQKVDALNTGLPIRKPTAPLAVIPALFSLSLGMSLGRTPHKPDAKDEGSFPSRTQSDGRHPRFGSTGASEFLSAAASFVANSPSGWNLIHF